MYACTISQNILYFRQQSPWKKEKTEKTNTYTVENKKNKNNSNCIPISAAQIPIILRIQYRADLCFVEAERWRYLYPPRSSEVLIEVELLLKLRQLFVGEVGAAEVRLMRIEMMVMMVMSAEMMMWS